jgi:hypothetical protein
MNPQNLLAAADIRSINEDMPVKPTRSKQSGVKCLWAIRSCHHYDARVATEAIHFNQ